MKDMKMLQGFTEPCNLSGMPPDTPILVGFSGGADSRALLELLCRYTDAPIYAAHVNHCIRGDEAIRDREFCRRIANEHGIGFFCIDADVPAEARKNHESLEAAARRVRYGFFEKVMKEVGIPLLATAHNADDNLETLLFNIARGSSANGACGIPPVRNFFDGGRIIRPLLNCSKRDILRFCSENGYEYVTDSTNADVGYSRNRIRRNIVPELEKLFPSPQKAAARLCADLREDCEFIGDCAERFLDGHIKDGRADIAELSTLHASVLRRVLVLMFGAVSDSVPEAVHLNAIMSMLKKGVGAEKHSLSLPDGVCAVFADGKLGFVKGLVATENIAADYCIPLENGANEVFGQKILVLCNVTADNGINSENIYKLSIKADINSAKIEERLYIRNRRAGDTVRINGMSKKLKKLFCDKKVPQSLRDILPIICDRNGERILFVPFVGYCDGAEYRGGDNRLSAEILLGIE